MDPPIHTENFLSGGVTTLTFLEAGTRFVSSEVMRSENPGNIVLPPDKIKLQYISLLASIGHFITDLYTIS